MIIELLCILLYFLLRKYQLFNIDPYYNNIYIIYIIICLDIN